MNWKLLNFLIFVMLSLSTMAQTKRVPFDPNKEVYEYEANPNPLDTGVEERWKLQKEQEKLDLIKNILICLFTGAVILGALKFSKVYKSNKTNGKDS